MNGKKLLLTLFGIASSAVWGPQAWTAYQTSQEPEPVYPSAYDVDATGIDLRMKMTASEPQAAPQNQAPEGRPSQATAALQAGAPDSQSGAPQVQQLLSILETFGGPETQTLSKLLETTPSWIGNQAAIESKTIDGLGIGVSSLTVKQAGTDRKRDQQATVTTFLAGSPLSAIVTTDSGAWALLGGRIVREGDVLLPRLLSVRSIRDRHLVLKGPEGNIEIQLPAFTASSSSSAVTQEDAAAAEQDGQNSASPMELNSMPALDQS